MKTTLICVTVLGAISQGLGQEVTQVAAGIPVEAVSAGRDALSTERGSVLLFAQAFLGSDESLDRKHVEFFRKDGQDNVTRLNVDYVEFDV